MAAGPGPSTTPRRRSPATSPASSSASGPAIPSTSTRCPRSRGPPTCAQEVPREPSARPQEPGRRLAGHPRPAGPPSSSAAGRQWPAAGHAAAGLVLTPVHRGLAGRAGGDLAPAALALVALRPGRPRLDRPGAGCDRPRGGPAPPHLRPAALLAVRRPPLWLRPATRVQGVVATPPRWIESSCSFRASAGVFQPRVLRGRLLRAAATAARSPALWLLRSVPLGKYWRSSPLVFSLVPRCQGLCGSQK